VHAALVVGVDDAAGKMSLYDPQTYGTTGDDVKLPPTFTAKLPLVEARLGRILVSAPGDR
jgi:hypothetical protein